MEDITKKCLDCSNEFPLSNFHKNSKGAKGVMARCKPCQNARYNINRNKRRDYVNNRERLRNYNLSQDEYNSMWESQNKSCAICKTQNNNNKTWAIDHDHDSGKVRGILCLNCNWMLGHAKDNLEILDAAGRYLASQIGLL